MGTVMFKNLISTKFNLCCLKSISWEGRWWFKNRGYTQALSFVGSSDDVDRLAFMLHRASLLLVWHLWHLAWHPLWQRSFHLGSEMCAKPKLHRITSPCHWELQFLAPENTVSRSWEIPPKYNSPASFDIKVHQILALAKLSFLENFLQKGGFTFFAHNCDHALFLICWLVRLVRYIFCEY